MEFTDKEVYETKEISDNVYVDPNVAKVEDVADLRRRG